MSIVPLIKFSVSPHSPLPVYVTVSFQALLGALLFGIISNLRIAALQKLIVMTIIYGNSLWEAIDVFFNYALHQFGIKAAGADFRVSLWLMSSCIGLYVPMGIFVGLLPGAFSKEIRNTLADPARLPLQRSMPASERPGLPDPQNLFGNASP